MKTALPEWHDPSRLSVTPEHVYRSRREFLRRVGITAITAGAFGSSLAAAAEAFRTPPVDRPVTDEKLATSYNNFYEFSLDKDEVRRKVEGWKLGPWKLEISGLCDRPKTWDLAELIRQMGVEERIYRFRCVEAWSMVVPWTGFQLSKLIELAKPKPSAKFIRFQSLADAAIMPNIKGMPQYPWPYTEGLTLEEARHPLTLLATGLYGKPMPRQNGAPIRLVVPWKYGFKSIKSIVKIDFTQEQPKTLWSETAPKEYGFYANVNPTVDHPRWSQKSERILDGSFFPKKVPTLLFNGYEKEVASLYAGLDLKKFY